MHSWQASTAPWGPSESSLDSVTWQSVLQLTCPGLGSCSTSGKPSHPVLAKATQDFKGPLKHHLLQEAVLNHVPLYHIWLGSLLYPDEWGPSPVFPVAPSTRMGHRCQVPVPGNKAQGQLLGSPHSALACLHLNSADKDSGRVDKPIAYFREEALLRNMGLMSFQQQCGKCRRECLQISLFSWGTEIDKQIP